MKLLELCVYLEAEFGAELKSEERRDGRAYYWQTVTKAPTSTRLLRISQAATGEVCEIKLAQSSINTGIDEFLPLPASMHEVAAALRAELAFLQGSARPQIESPAPYREPAAMDPRVARLHSVADCDAFSINARRLGAPELADQARRRAVQIRADSYGATSDVERECLQAVYAYEEVLSVQKGKRQPASRTWQMIKRHGIIPAVERVVTKREVSVGFTALSQMDMMDYAFEAVILRHPTAFSNEAVEISRQRIAVS